METMRVRSVAIGLAAVAYVAATHGLMTRAPSSIWTPLVLLAPMFIGPAVFAWQAGRPGLAAAALGAGGLLLGALLRADGASPQVLYLMQHVVIHLALAAVFGATLRRGAQPLISRLATRVHGALPAPMADYTRKLTAVWTLYFVTMAAVSLALYANASFSAWAVFANLLTPLALVALTALPEEVLPTLSV